MNNQKLNELLEIELRESELQTQLKNEITEKIELIKNYFSGFIVSNKVFQESNSMKFEFSYSNSSIFKIELTIEYAINNPDFCFAFPFKINNMDSETFTKIIQLQQDIFSHKSLFLDLQKNILKLRNSYLLMKGTQNKIETEKKLIIVNHFNKPCSDLQFLKYLAGSNEKWFYSLLLYDNKISLHKNSFEEKSETFETAYLIYRKYIHTHFIDINTGLCKKDPYEDFKRLFDFDYSNPNYKKNIVNFYIINQTPYFRPKDMNDVFYSDQQINNRIFMNQNNTTFIDNLLEEVYLSKNIENF